MKRLLLILLAAASLGAGCITPGAAPTLVTQPQAPQRELTPEEKLVAIAKANTDAERDANELTVALVLLQGEEPPAGAVLGGVIGCGDRIAYTKAPRTGTSDWLAMDAVAALLAIRDNSKFPPYYDALANSKVGVEKVQSRDGITTEVWLHGTMNPGGVCDVPRMKEQVERTALRFAPKVAVYLNGSQKNWRCFSDQSGQCK